jgi:hypothetical protein
VKSIERSDSWDKVDDASELYAIRVPSPRDLRNRTLVETRADVLRAIAAAAEIFCKQFANSDGETKNTESGSKPLPPK